MRARSLGQLLIVLLLSACAPPGPEIVDDGNEPLSELAPLFEDAPADRGMSLAFDSKADEVIPETFDLMEYQSPVRSQGRRGTCTIFATTALMESLYIREGTLANPDFSEQFLQWSAKFEVRSFPSSSGSNPSYNLQAINRYGIVEESLWPYESSQWNASNDPECDGEDDQPTRCYTNGTPPEPALTANRYRLPRGRWINPRAASIQGHMLSTRTPVVVSGDFFYQSWNHGRSTLQTSSERKANGWVLAPNEEDVMDSSGDRRAGHGFLLVGWDQNLSVPRVDGEGNELTDENGDPVMETGFFLFKNSWGTSSFGTNNPHGAGYGWISYEYVERYLTAYVSGLPEVTRVEVCNDGRDNDGNGLADCEDAACASDRSCMDPNDAYENRTPAPIPDNDPSGATSTITVEEGGTISSLAVHVNISHSYRGDLTLRLIREGDGLEALLAARSGGSADDIVETFTVADFNGTDAAGTYRLVVVDGAAQDTGTLNGWSLDVTRCEGDCGGIAVTRTYTDEAGADIPDDASLTRTLSVDAPGEVTGMSVTLDITHTFPYELTVRLAQSGGPELVLVTEDTSASGGIQRTIELPGFVGTTAAADYTLTVVDGAAGDTGTLDGWSLQVTSQ